MSLLLLFGGGPQGVIAPQIVNVDYYAEMSQATGYSAEMSQVTGYYAVMSQVTGYSAEIT